MNSKSSYWITVFDVLRMSDEERTKLKEQALAQLSQLKELFEVEADE